MHCALTILMYISFFVTHSIQEGVLKGVELEYNEARKPRNSEVH